MVGAIVYAEQTAVFTVRGTFVLRAISAQYFRSCLDGGKVNVRQILSASASCAFVCFQAQGSEVEMRGMFL